MGRVIRGHGRIVCGRAVSRRATGQHVSIAVKPRVVFVKAGVPPARVAVPAVPRAVAMEMNSSVAAMPIFAR